MSRSLSGALKEIFNSFSFIVTDLHKFCLEQFIRDKVATTASAVRVDASCIPSLAGILGFEVGQGSLPLARGFREAVSKGAGRAEGLAVNHLCGSAKLQEFRSAVTPQKC